MTFAPPTLLALQHLWVSNDGIPLGIVGDARHVATGVSYHLGKSALRPDAYSRVLPRDVRGLSEAASAIDFGQLHGSLHNLQRFSVWLVEQTQAHPAAYNDIREIIYSPDGLHVKRWDNYLRVMRAGGDGTGQGDNTHLWHTHVSLWRDSEFRPKTQLIERYFTGVPAPADPPGGTDVGINVRLNATVDATPLDAFRLAKVKGAGHDAFRLSDAKPVMNMAAGADLQVVQLGLIVAPVPNWARGREPCAVFNIGGEAHVMLQADLDLSPLPTAPDPTPGKYTQADLDHAHLAGYGEAKSKAVAAVNTI